jgi:SAM-dependent methyltransferase
MKAGLFRSSLRWVGRALRCWVAEQTLKHLRDVRLYELSCVLPFVPEGARVLELGAGRGWQAEALRSYGFAVTALDVARSMDGREDAVGVDLYDGREIPYPAGSFHVVFTSNVLEHVADVKGLLDETARVLRADGWAIHVVPTGVWRFWTNVTHVLRYLSVPPVHGERGRNCIDEIRHLRVAAWSAALGGEGWTVVSCKGSGLFYTGCSAMDGRLNIRTRRILARLLGSSSRIVVVQRVERDGAGE